MLYPRVSLYALMLAAAGIPLYIHLPRFAAVQLGIGLSAIGTVLILIRLADLVQDPLIGWAIDRWPNWQSGFAVLAAFGLMLGFPLLFSLPENTKISVLISILILLFSAYSLGTILLYGRSATLARKAEPKELMTLAAYREGGQLAGVIVAAAAPALFAAMGAKAQGYPAFGIFLGVLAAVTLVLTRPIWRRTPITGQGLTFAGLGKSGGIHLLALALVNSLPAAITATLFLFFVEDRLNLPGKAGPLLLLFFLSAALSVPIWTRLSNRIGPKRTLTIAMPLSIAAFSGAAFLSEGNFTGFALICLASGAAMGADVVIIPALFSVALTRAGLNASAAFGIWSFAGKLGLALAAFLTLPLLERNGFSPGQANPKDALETLNFAYAILPCILKLGAFALVLTLPTKVSAT